MTLLVEYRLHPLDNQSVQRSSSLDITDIYHPERIGDSSGGDH